MNRSDFAFIVIGGVVLVGLYKGLRFSVTPTGGVSIYGENHMRYEIILGLISIAGFFFKNKILSTTIAKKILGQPTEPQIKN